MPDRYKLKKEDLFILKHSTVSNSSADEMEKDKLDWEYIFERSSKTWTVVMLYHNLKSKGIIKQIPDKILNRFKNIYTSNSIYNLSLLDEFKEIMMASNKRGIRAVPIKGFSMMLDIYPNAGMRGVKDLDLLIDKKDKDEIFSIFKAFGYERKIEEEKKYGHDHHYNLAAKNRAISSAEIHHKLFPWYMEALFARIKSEEVLERSREITWRDIKVYKMEEIDEFIFPLLSYYAHDFSQVKYLFDADAILRKTVNFDWQEFLKRIIKYDILNQISYGIIICKRYLDTPIPKDIYAEILRLSKRTYPIVEMVLPISLRKRKMSRWGSRLMRFNECGAAKNICSALKEGLIQHSYRKFGLFSDYIKKNA